MVARPLSSRTALDACEVEVTLLLLLRLRALQLSILTVGWRLARGSRFLRIVMLNLHLQARLRVRKPSSCDGRGLPSKVKVLYKVAFMSIFPTRYCRASANPELHLLANWFVFVMTSVILFTWSNHCHLTWSSTRWAYPAGCLPRRRNDHGPSASAFSPRAATSPSALSRLPYYRSHPPAKPSTPSHAPSGPPHRPLLSYALRYWRPPEAIPAVIFVSTSAASFTQIDSHLPQKALQPWSCSTGRTSCHLSHSAMPFCHGNSPIASVFTVSFTLLDCAWIPLARFPSSPSPLFYRPLIDKQNPCRVSLRRRFDADVELTNAVYTWRRHAVV